ncbi:FAD-dependent oxidoreductase [Neopusillimonas aestuarii]|uniref:FAD-dependent oxidoreductase n=1 Tax=Neopusillimonas aestuarii TaxID=2716226 RepID=UPI0019802195|nr:FAD-dependent oxidoreductase [Pusillimonas sp. DMV24BSW_D]
MDLETDVLIIGAGPVGLALAGDLGWRGKRCIVVERGDGVVVQPKMDQVGIRTMELCRRWGLVKAVEASPYNRDYPQDNIYLTSLNGWELGREPFPSMNDDRPPPYSPQKRERCPQNMFDPILRDFAQSHSYVQLLYHHTFKHLEQQSEGVLATVYDDSKQQTITVKARFLVGCDGARSRVREMLDIPMSGKGLLTYTTNVIFRCENLNQLHEKRPGYRHLFLGSKGTWGTLVAINGRDNWRMSIVGDQVKRNYTHDELRQFAYQMMGKPFDLEILSVLSWARYELVADQYRKGHCFLAGDACHLTSPTGGLGMNTGITDAAALGWMLSACLDGWGGEFLLDAYEPERRPIAQQIVQISTRNLQAMKSVGRHEALLDDSQEGEQARAHVGRTFSEAMRKEWYLDNVHLGYRYLSSPAIVYEQESAAQVKKEQAETAVYTPSTQPGRRAPHYWLAPDESTLDAFGRGYVLVDTGLAGDEDGADWQAWSLTATRLKIPLKRVRWANPELARLYQKRFVLVRPDDIVAWRGDALPANPQALLQFVTGQSRVYSEKEGQ